ncbi:MAG: electron transport complex subunit RsxA [Xylanivirga thermophila]|jgi:Na+-translocating ferredoxin:NAD+ oxidoreductase subunit A|uniref:electron transport complex subunit RsxA n=1 Tax=Xylanivirga thermophila TaxID=2496273 RepID=UPI00101BF942|nr:electron transport complex subunit RsxA [Xylanivirga thermophila]
MGYFGKLMLLFISSILINNVVLARSLAICPFLGVSKRVNTALGMGTAVTFVIALASVITYIVYYAILVPLGIEYMQIVAFILVIAALVQFIEMVIQKSSPTLYKALGVYLPLITTNCAVLGTAIINIQEEYDLLQTLVNGVGIGLGFTLAIVLFAGIRERQELADIPEHLQGFPIALITAGLMSIAFMGFQGLIK